MTQPARFVHQSVALAYDSKHDVVVKVVRGTDDQGRPWEQYDDGPWVPIAQPDDPGDTQKAVP